MSIWLERKSEMAAVLNQILMWCFGLFSLIFHYLICSWERIYAWCFQLLLLIIIFIEHIQTEKQIKNILWVCKWKTRTRIKLYIVHRYAENISFNFRCNRFQLSAKLIYLNTHRNALRTKTDLCNCDHFTIHYFIHYANDEAKSFLSIFLLFFRLKSLFCSIFALATGKFFRSLCSWLQNNV